MLSAPEEMIGKRRAVLGKLTLTPLVRLSPRKCRPAAWMAPRLIHLRLYNKISRSLQLTLDLRFALFFASFVSPERLKANRQIGFVLPSLPRVSSLFARNDYIYVRSSRAPGVFTVLQTRVPPFEVSVAKNRLYRNKAKPQKASVTGAFWKTGSSLNSLIAHRSYWGASGTNVAAAWRSVPTVRTIVRYRVIDSVQTQGDSRRIERGRQGLRRREHLPAVFPNSSSWLFALRPSRPSWSGSVGVLAHLPSEGTIASRAQASSSGLVGEYGSSRRFEYWTQKLERGENPPAQVRNPGPTGGNVLSPHGGLFRWLFVLRPPARGWRGSREIPTRSPLEAVVASRAYLSIWRLGVGKDNVRNPASVGGSTLSVRIGLFSRWLFELLPNLRGWRGSLGVPARPTRAVVATSKVQLLGSTVAEYRDIRRPASVGGNMLSGRSGLFHRWTPGSRGWRGSFEVAARSTIGTVAARRKQLLDSRPNDSGGIRNPASVGENTLSGRGGLISGLLYGPLSSARGWRESFAVPARSTPRAVGSSRTHPLHSRLPDEHGDPRHSEHWWREFPKREDRHVVPRSSMAGGGKMREDLSATPSRESSDPMTGKASPPAPRVGGKLFYRPLFAVGLAVPITHALLTPIVSEHSRFKTLPHNVIARALPGGDVASARLVHVNRRAKSLATPTNGKSVGTTAEQSYQSRATADLAGRNRGILRELVASRRDMQVLSQCVYEIIVDRVRREKERIGH